MKTTTLDVTGMTCGHCVAAVTRAIQAVPGVESVNVSLERAQAVVGGDADAKSLVAAVKEQGYAATPRN
ncbi:MAG TPA: heavy-metal-associated domain-containing protein [Burkholderiaceae bacterium]|nr:heavy-metal-associated domain-containing protein [Burkholderiaceae bacterium]